MLESKSAMFIPYPTGIMRWLFRLPLLLYRIGLGEAAGRILVLTTRGRKTGQARFTPLEYRRHGSKLYLLSAWGERPDWYQNLLADPLVTAQTGRQVYSARAQVITDPAEALRVLYMFRRTSPVIYDRVLARLSSAENGIDLNTLVDLAGEFTLVRLDLLPDRPLLPPLPADQKWVLPALALMLVVVLVGLTRSRR